MFINLKRRQVMCAHTSINNVLSLGSINKRQQKNVEEKLFFCLQWSTLCHYFGHHSMPNEMKITREWDWQSKIELWLRFVAALNEWIFFSLQLFNRRKPQKAFSNFFLPSLVHFHVCFYSLPLSRSPTPLSVDVSEAEVRNILFLYAEKWICVSLFLFKIGWSLGQKFIKQVF